MYHRQYYMYHSQYYMYHSQYYTTESVFTLQPNIPPLLDLVFLHILLRSLE